MRIGSVIKIQENLLQDMLSLSTDVQQSGRPITRPWVHYRQGEAEYVAVYACDWDVSWIRRLFWEISHQRGLKYGKALPETLMQFYSTAAIYLPSNVAAESKTKKISMKHHHVFEIVLYDIICTTQVKSWELAYPLTKDFTSENHNRIIKQ